MPTNARVTIRYGPYESNGLVQHRTFRLEGLQGIVSVLLASHWGFCLISLAKHCPDDLFTEALTARGHQCVLEESREWNVVELVVNGELVFRCFMKQLEFGGDGKLDPVCKEAVTAVDDAY